jgi:hypothetical protein
VLNVSSIVIASICGLRLLALTPTEVPLSTVSPRGQYFVDGMTSFIQYKVFFMCLHPYPLCNLTNTIMSFLFLSNRLDQQFPGIYDGSLYE